MIFISHSSRDAEAASELKERILECGYNSAQVFLDSDADSGIAAGSRWEEALYKHLKDCRALILVGSQNWKESHWCFAEFVYARAAGKEIIPLLVEEVDLGPVVGAHQAVSVHKEGDRAYDRLFTALDSRHLGPQEDFGWPPPGGDDCPFPGLLAFDERLAGVYFGREPEREEVLQELRRMRANGEPRLLMITGGSGSGKSSLLRAGVLPRLKHKTSDTEWLVLPTLRYGESANQQQTIFDQLALNIAQSFPAETRTSFDWKSLRTALAAKDEKAFRDAAADLTLARGSTDATVLLPIDQFEELLAPGVSAVASDFLALLKSAFSQANGRLLAIATIRSDYLDVYERHPHALAAPSLLAWRLGMFPRDRVRDVIVTPAERAEVEIAPDLLARLESDAPTAEALPLLAFTLEKLYRKYAKDGKLELQEYVDLGGMEGAIEKSAEGIASQLSPESLAALRLAFVNHLAAVNSKDEVVRVTAR